MCFMYRYANPVDMRVPLWHMGLAYKHILAHIIFYAYLHIRLVFPLKISKLIFLKFQIQGKLSNAQQHSANCSTNCQ